VGQGILERGGWVNKKGAFRCQLSNIATNHLGTNQRWNYLEDSRISSRIILELIHYYVRWYFWGSKSAWLWLKHVVPRDPLLERSFLRLETISWLWTSTMFSWLDLLSLVFQMLSGKGTSTCWSLKGWMPSSTNSCQTRIAVSWLPKPSEVLASPALQVVHEKIGMGVIVAIVIPRSWMGFQL